MTRLWQLSLNFVFEEEGNEPEIIIPSHFSFKKLRKVSLTGKYHKNTYEDLLNFLRRHQNKISEFEVGYKRDWFGL